MSLRAHSLLRRICKIDGRRSSTAAYKEYLDEHWHIFRTTQSNPINHNESHLNKFYTVPSDIYKNLYQNNISNTFKTYTDVFAECSILVRKPAIEIISYLEQTDYTKPVNKYVLFGEFGTGKTTTLLHIMHYAYMKNFIIVNVPWPNIWFRFPKEIAESSLLPNKLDLPIDAGAWLHHFKNQNAKLLSQLDLRTTKDYVWNQREETKKGTSFLELIQFGIIRLKYACGVISALIDELKIASTAGKCKTLVAIDGYNAFYAERTSIRDDNKVYVPADRISLTQAFINSTDYQWCNGAIVLTVDRRATKDKRDNNFPRYLLGKKGFEYLDPFVPIAIENYTNKEFDAVLNYYKDRKWIRNITQTGQLELELLSNKNAYSLLEYCKAL